MADLFKGIYRKVYKEDISVGEGTEYVIANDGSYVNAKRFNAKYLPLLSSLYQNIVPLAEQDTIDNSVNDVLLYLNEKVKNLEDSNLTTTNLPLGDAESNNSSILSMLNGNMNQSSMNMMLYTLLMGLVTSDNNTNGLYYYNIDLSTGSKTLEINASNLKLTSEIVLRLVGNSLNNSITTNVNVRLSNANNISQKIKFSTLGYTENTYLNSFPRINFYIDNVLTAIPDRRNNQSNSVILDYNLVNSVPRVEQLEILHLDNNLFIYDKF